MRAVLLTLNGLLFIFVLFLTVTDFGANSHLPLLEWGMFLSTPVPFLFLVISLPFMPYRDSKQYWLALQAFGVGLLLAFAWLSHASEPLSNGLGAASMLLALASLTFNLRTILRSANASAGVMTTAYAPLAAALVIALLVIRNEAARPIDGKLYQQLFEAHQNRVAAGDKAAAEETAKQIRSVAVRGMVEKGYSQGYSEEIAKDTPIEYLVPLMAEWKLVKE